MVRLVLAALALAAWIATAIVAYPTARLCAPERGDG